MVVAEGGGGSMTILSLENKEVECPIGIIVSPLEKKEMGGSTITPLCREGGVASSPSLSLKKIQVVVTLPSSPWRIKR